MPHAKNGDHEICFEEFGSAEDEALLLVNGYRSQMINYEPKFDCGFSAQRFELVELLRRGK